MTYIALLALALLAREVLSLSHQVHTERLQILVQEKAAGRRGELEAQAQPIIKDTPEPAPIIGFGNRFRLLPIDTSDLRALAGARRSWRPWLSAENDGTWISRVRQWHQQQHGVRSVGIHDFFSSAVTFEWMVFVTALPCFFLLHLYLFDWPSRRSYHAIALILWLLAAGLYDMVIWAHLGSSYGSRWLVGYFLEFVFSIENVFIYHIVVEAFKVPRKAAQKALFIVVVCQIVFQMVFFMGLASWLKSLHVLPYLLGAWLIYVGVQSMREGEHASFDFKETKIFRVCHWVLGDRLCPSYQGNTVVFTENGRTRFTLLLPAIACLLLVDFVMEVDVTLTKIEEMRNHYIGFTSSAAAAFAVPEVFFVARDLFNRFVLLKYGVSFVLLFFGAQLLLHNVVYLSDMVGIFIIACVMVLCIVLSRLMGLPPRTNLDDESDELEQHVPKVDAGIRIQGLSASSTRRTEDPPKG